MSRLVVGVDGSANSRAALAWAVMEARLRGDEVAVVTVNNARVTPGDVAGVSDQQRHAVERIASQQATSMLEELVAPFADSGAQITTHVLEGVPSEVLVNHAVGSNGLIVGARGSGAYRHLLLGSVSQQVVVHARCPVVVVPAAGAEDVSRRKVIVGVDGSHGAHLALERAAEEARLRGCELLVVMVQPPPPTPGNHALAETGFYAYMWMGMPPPRVDSAADVARRHQQLIDHWHRAAEDQLTTELAQLDPTVLPRKVTPTVVDARHPAGALLDMAQGADLLVVGSRGRGGFAGMLLGSVSQQCVRHATAPVLVVPGGTP